MKHSIRTLSLTTLALFVSLAITARANSPSDLLSTATRAHGGAGPSQTGKLFHFLPATETYILDDGTAEDAVGLTLGGDIISLNQFTVIPGDETINSISIAWGTPAFFDPSLDGLPYTAVLWSDPNGDGQPDDAAVLATAPGVVASQGTNTFLITPITPTGVATSFFVGFIITHSAGQFPSAFDESAPVFNRSFVAGATAPGTGNIDCLPCNELPVAPIESFGLFGNWLIRATAGTSGGGLTLLSAFSEKGSVRGGPWDIDLPLTGGGVEDRSGGPHIKFALYFVFNNNLVSVGSATTSCGTVASFGIPSDALNQAEVDIVNAACNASEVTVAVNNLVDDQGNTLASASITFCLLLGDVNGDHVVDQHDVSNVNHHLGQSNDASNFRDDINNSGNIDGLDLKQTKKAVGTSCP